MNGFTFFAPSKIIAFCCYHCCFCFLNEEKKKILNFVLLKKKSWLADQRVDTGVKWRGLGAYKNWIAAISVITEFIQLCSFSFISSVPWPRPVGKAMSWPNLKFSGSFIFSVLFWTSVSVAIAARFFLEVTRLRIPLISKRIQLLFFILYVFMALLYLPVVGHIVEGVSCTYKEGEIPRFDATITADMEDSQDFSGALPCWKGVQILYAAVGLLVLVIFYPFAALCIPVVHYLYIIYHIIYQHKPFVCISGRRGEVKASTFCTSRRISFLSLK